MTPNDKNILHKIGIDFICNSTLCEISSPKLCEVCVMLSNLNCQIVVCS